MKHKLGAACYELLYAKGDVGAWLGRARLAGATSCRFFAEADWMVSKTDVVGPFVHTAAGFDGARWEPRYWDRVDEVYRLMKTVGIRPHVVLFDYCSWKMKGPTWRALVPWLNLAGAPEVDHLSGAVLSQQRRYVRRHVAAAAAAGVTPEFEICNEYYWPGHTDAQGLAWHKAIADELMAQGASKADLITSAKWDLDMDILTSLARQVGTYSFHGAGARDGEIPWQAVRLMKRAAAVELSSDGVFKGQGAADNEGSRGNSAAEMVHIAREMKANGITRYDFKDRGISDKTTESNLTQCGVISNVDLADLAPLRAMAQELGAEIPVPPAPGPPKPTPPIPPTPPSPTPSAAHKLNPWLIAAVVAAVAILALIFL